MLRAKQESYTKKQNSLKNNLSITLKTEKPLLIIMTGKINNYFHFETK